MKALLMIGGIIVVVLVVFVLVVVVIGYRLPQQHVASRSIRLNRPVTDIYATVRDFGAYPKWRSDVQTVDLLDENGKVRFREHGKHGNVTYEVDEDVPSKRLVTRIVDQNLGYSGSWTYEFIPSNNATVITITENGVVSNPIFRFMSRHIFGQTATIDAYLTNMAKHFGELVEPRKSN